MVHVQSRSSTYSVIFQYKYVRQSYFSLQLTFIENKTIFCHTSIAIEASTSSVVCLDLHYLGVHSLLNGYNLHGNYRQHFYVYSVEFIKTCPCTRTLWEKRK